MGLGVWLATDLSDVQGKTQTGGQVVCNTCTLETEPYHVGSSSCRRLLLEEQAMSTAVRAENVAADYLLVYIAGTRFVYPR